MGRRFMQGWSWWLALVLAGCATTPETPAASVAMAPAPTPAVNALLAVLEFDSPDESAPLNDLQLLTDAFRGVAVHEAGTGS